VIKDDAELEDVSLKIYNLMQIPKLTKKQGQALVSLCNEVEIYEAQLEICDFRKKLNEVWSAIEELEKKGDSRTERDIIKLIESRKKRSVMCQQFANLHTTLKALKKGGE